MDLEVYAQLIFLCVVNTAFTLSGAILNTLVIACFLKSSQLRKKLCNFMIMVLSCFDFAAVIITHPILVIYLVFWATENYDLLKKTEIYSHYTTIFLGSSFFALLVMNFERYLGTYYPIFHYTSVTKRRMLTLLAMLVVLSITETTISANDLIVSQTEAFIIFISIAFPPFIFVNYKLFRISRKVRRSKETLPEKRTIINLKNINTCLLAFACLLIVSIPSAFYLGFCFVEKSTTNNARLSFVWATTIYSMNGTFNSLIFFWKNKVLRREGIKILKTLKDCLFLSSASVTNSLDKGHVEINNASATIEVTDL